MKKDAIRLFFKTLLTKFGKIDTDQGTLVFDGEQIEIGTKVQFEDTESEEMIAYKDVPDGDYKAGDTTFTVKDSIVTAIDKQEEAAEEPVDTQMEGETPEVVEEAADMVTEVADENKEQFDAEEAYKAIMITVADLTGRVDALQSSVEALLTKPGAEPVFEQYSRVNNKIKNENKSLFKVNR